MIMAKIAEINPTIFFQLARSLNAKKPISAENATTETLVMARTVESGQPVVL